MSKAAVRILGGDISVLRIKWHAALTGDSTLPRYEEVVLGSLGKLADRLMLIGGDGVESFEALQVGAEVGKWTGTEVRGRKVADFPPDCAMSISDAIVQALAAREPTYTVSHRVRDGIVTGYEILALPMSSRWGPPVVGVYIRENDLRYDLIDSIFRSTNEGILALAAIRDSDDKVIDFQIVALNDAAPRLLRTPAETLLWRRLSEVSGGLNSPGVRERLLNTLETGDHGDLELAVRLDGEDVHLKLGISSTGDLLSVTATDIGDLKSRETSFRLLFDGNPVPMWLYDADSLRFLGVNDAAVAHYGFSREQFLAMTLLQIWPRDEWQEHEQAARRVGLSYQSERTWRHLKHDKSEIEVLTYARRVNFGRQEAILVAVVDVTERKRAEARIAYMAHHDALTALPNRVLFHEHLTAALVRAASGGRMLAVLCLDLDQFKGVNDTLGHPVGDLLLKRVAGRLERAVGEENFVARLGGDEFAIVMPAIENADAAQALAGKLVDELGQPYDIHDHEVIIGASIGIALAPSDGSSPELLLRNADIALYRAKADGRGRLHFFEPEMDRRLKLRRSLELDLRKAFANGELELHYQPLVNLCSGEVSGFEALLRWRHPHRGMVPPAEFIPVAEEIGLIVPLGEWVLRKACEDAAGWADGIKVAVNLSPVQFKSRNLVFAVTSALAYSGLPARRLELEITESVLLGETEANLATLHQLRELGVQISMDDFGTGYSSLSYLRSFPFDKIKIDQSFVRELAERPDCMAIVRAITGLGASLGIATTAEGVETQEQLERLRAEGCTEVQGYLFSPPRPLEEIKCFLRQESPAAAKVA
ncbi:MAG TPA: EAL domain-containing protein [Xanthobacteraceae bacterium]|nr:EAL domain-containing protein [Xanthobacteraceae bacterium]